MPRRSEHKRAGAVIGVAAATLRASATNSRHVLVEAAAGAVGGVIGGLLPDVLEPSLSSDHRDLWHSVFVGTTLSIATFKSWEVACRARCTHWERTAATHLPGSAERLAAERNAMLCAAGAAFLVGLAAGYALHLLMDGDTPRGIPVVVR